MLRILLADDHDIVRRGLRELLEEQPGWEVCGEAGTGREALEQALRLRPHVVVLDLMMPELNGLEAARHIRKALPATEVLVFTMHDSEELVHEILSTGARGYVLKSDAARHLVSAVEALSRHQPFFSSRVSATVLDGYLSGSARSDARSAPSRTLTDREREVVQLLTEGRSNKEVASILHISVKTVETHRAAIMRKLGVGSIVELVHYAIRNKLIQP
jgi:DNA-binding NarL/FixJ family response regulator